MSTETRCEHCGRRIVQRDGRWLHVLGGLAYCLADTKATPRRSKTAGIRGVA